MTEVRKHTRRTASGRTTTVRHHTRNTGDSQNEAERARAAGQERAAPHVSALRQPPAAPDETWWDEEAQPAGDWWDETGEGDYEVLPGQPPQWPAPDGWDDPAPATRRGDRAFPAMQAEMREWRSRPVPAPPPDEPMNPQLARALGCDTPEGLAKYERGRAYREAGYNGPLDQDNNIPDPDDPANHESLHALAALSEI